MEFDDPRKVLSRTAQIRALAKSDPDAATIALGGFLKDVLDLDAHSVCVNNDQYSLNSLNGFFAVGEQSFFFKFHQEEGEEDMQGEYYRAELLSDANLPIDLPVYKSTTPGEQVLVYKKRDDLGFSDVLRDIDATGNPQSIARAVRAEGKLNEQILRVALNTLHPVTVAQVQSEPIHHLFFERMIDAQTGRAPGGRYARFYLGKTYPFALCDLSWDAFSTAQLVLNGQSMKHSFGEIFDRAATHLDPTNLADAGGVTAHGDAHNANVWYLDEPNDPSLSYFDPAFAGEHIPSLIAEVKATFHNVFAHPYWLYDPELAKERFSADVLYENGKLFIDTDWNLSEVRQQLLQTKIDTFWKPFLMHLASKKMLPLNWRDVLRSSLAMCPALVMNLRANQGTHNEISSAIGFYVTALAGSEPIHGSTIFTKFFDQIDPTIK